VIKCAQGRRVRLSQSLLEKLIIIDDGMSTYNAYKSKSRTVNRYRQYNPRDTVDEADAERPSPSRCLAAARTTE
jgi:hypothetical protein